MKLLFLAALALLSSTSFAQFYYKDILGTKETANLISTYESNKVRGVLVNSYDADNTKIDEMVIRQSYSPEAKSLTTITQSIGSSPSILTTYFDASGRVLRTVDSSGIIAIRTVYSYDAAGQLKSLLITTADSVITDTQTEEHIWEYSNGKPVRMLKIKNKIDTTYISFKLDNNGNVVEEQETRKGKSSEPYYYYYDENNRLTDIVRFSAKAKRLLPEYLFEYSPANQVVQKITVPANSSEYIIWRYQFDQRGLKVKEAIYNKQKQLTGKVEYQYSYGG